MGGYSEKCPHCDKWFTGPGIKDHINAKHMARLNLLKSDLRDTNNLKVIAKYPHLDNEKLREQLRRQIAEEEAKLVT